MVGGGKPRVWSTLRAALGDAITVMRMAPGLTAATATFAFAYFSIYETVDAGLEPGWPKAVLSAVAESLISGVLVTPLSVAVYRWILIDERPGLLVLFGKQDILIRFAVMTTVISLAIVAPLLFAEDIVKPEDAPARFWISFAAFLGLLILSVRLSFLGPAIATRSVLARPGASWRMTRGVCWRLAAAIALLFSPLLPFGLIAAIAEAEGMAIGGATTVAATALAMLLILSGSAVVARFYAWRFAQG